MNTHFDVIVIGVGSMGSSACYHLAQRGYKVLGIEQFDITHEYGSHAGQSRIIRKAYFENSDYELIQPGPLNVFRNLLYPAILKFYLNPMLVLLRLKKPYGFIQIKL